MNKRYIAVPCNDWRKYGVLDQSTDQMVESGFFTLEGAQNVCDHLNDEAENNCVCWVVRNE